MASAILQAILILFILAFSAGLVFQALAFILATRRRDRARAIPQGHWQGHWADRVTAQDIRRANWAADRDAQGVKDFQRAQLLAGGATC